MKKLVLILLLFMFVFTLTACDDNDGLYNSGLKVKDDVTDVDEIKDDDPVEMLSLTLTELEAYDGKRDNLGYVAYDGKIYDVTNVWTNGEHNGVMAGTDITEKISNAPHGISVIEDLEQVGDLVE